MPGSGNAELKATIMLDGEQQFKKAVADASSGLKTLGTESKLIEEKFKGQANTLEALRAKHSVLSRTLEEHKKKEQAIADALTNAQKNYDKVGNGLTELRSRLEAAKSKLEEMKKTASSNEIADQEKEIKELNNAVKLGEQNYQRAGRSIQNWQQRLNNAQADGIRMNRELDQTANYLKEAEHSADGCASSIDAMGKQVKQSQQQMEDLSETAEKTAEQLEDGSQSAGIFGETLAANLASAGIEKGLDLAKQGVEAVKESMFDLSSASANLGAQTGATSVELERYKDVMMQIRGNNFGQDYNDVAEAMGVVIQTMGELNDTDLQAVTENAITLRDSFGYDYQETLRTTKMLMEQFGISSQEAFNLIVQGTQEGLNKNGDLLDTINEYAVHYAQMGTSADGFFNSLKNGTDAGTFSVDKLGDAYKEFGIRVKDTATTTDEAYELLGLNADEMRDKFAQGGESAREATSEVIAALMGMDDKVKQNQAGVDLFGTMWEDLGVDAVAALMNVNGEISSTKQAMDELNAVKYSDLESSISGLGAAIQENFLAPIADAMIPLVTGAAQKATDVINQIGEAIHPQKTELETFIEDIQSSNDEVQRILDSAKATMEGSGEDISQLDAYKEKLLEINAATEKTGFQKEQMRTIISSLAGSIPQLAAAFDSETGSIKLTSNEIVSLIEKQKELIGQNSAMEAYDMAKNAMEQAKENAENAKSALEEAQKELDAFMKMNGAAVDALMKAPGINFTDDALLSLWQRRKDAVKEAEAEVEQSTEALSEAEKQVQETGEKLGDMTEAMDESTDATGENTDATNENTDATEKQGQAAEETAEKVKTAADTQKEAMQSVKEAFASAKEEAESGIDVDFFSDKFDGGIDSSIEDLLENSKVQLEGLQNYADNLKEISSHVGKEIAPEFMEYLESLGTDGANVLEHISKTFEQDNGAELIKQWSDNYVSSLKIKDEISDALAADAVALKAKLGELGSTEVEFSGLKESIKAAEEEAAGAWDGLAEETKDALDSVVQTAQEYGVQIPEGLAEGIASGSISPEQAIEQMNGALQGSFDGLMEIAREAGVEGVDKLAEGFQSGDPAAVAAAMQALIDAIVQQTNVDGIVEAVDEGTSQIAPSIESYSGDAEAAGKTLNDSAAEGANDPSVWKSNAETGTKTFISSIESAKGNAHLAGTTLSKSVVEGLQAQIKAMEQAGRDSATKYLNAINAARGNAASAGDSLGSAAYNAAASYQGSFYSVGVNMAAGVASGIRAGASGAINAASSMASQALQAAKNALAIHSPSLKFRKEVGQQISTGMAFGIKDKASLAGKEATSMSNRVYKRATAWMLAYRNAHKISLEEEQYYWEQVQKHVKAGTAAYTKAQAQLSSINASILGKDLTSQLNSNFGVSWKNDKGETKSAKDYYSELYSAASKALSNYEIIHDASLEQEEQFWLKMTEKTEKGSQAWYDSMKQLKDVQAEIIEAEQEAQQKLLEAEQAAYEKAFEKTEQKYERRNIKAQANVKYVIKVANDELNSWKATLDKLEKGSDLWWEAKEHIISAQDDIISATEQYIANQETVGEMSLQKQLNRWKKTQALLDTGTQAWYDAQEKINELNDAIAEEREEAAEKEAEAAREAAEAEKEAAQQRIKTLQSVHSSLLSKYKTYYKVSAKAEMDYWDIARQQFNAGTDERIEADQRYLEAKEAFYEAQQELDEDYAEKKEEIDKKLSDSVKDLQDSYEDAVKDSKQQILSSFNLFEAWDAEGWDSDTLMHNLKTQVEGMKFWQQQLEELGKKGLTQEFLDELRDMGPEAAANLWSLNQMTAEQLNEYQRLWVQKNSMAQKQAEKDNEDLLAQTQEAIAEARKEAQEEMAALQKDYLDACAELNEGLSEGLLSLVTQAKDIGEEIVSALVEAVREGMTDVTAAITQAKALAGSATSSTGSSGGFGGTVSGTVSASAGSSGSSGGPEMEKVLAYIQSGQKRSGPATSEERQKHSGLWRYIADNYGYTVNDSIIKQIANAVSFPGDAVLTADQKRELLALLKKKGFAEGTRNVTADDLAWLLENSETEYIVRKSDGAIMQPVKTGDKIINPKGAENVYDFSNDPGTFLEPYIKTALASAQAEMIRQESALRQQYDSLDTSGIARLNRLTEQYPAPTVNIDNTGMLSAMERVVSGMGAIMDQLQALQERQIVMDTGELVGALQEPLSRATGAASIRRSRGRF